MAKIGRLTGPSNPDGTRPRQVKRLAGTDVEVLGSGSDVTAGRDVVAGRNVTAAGDIAARGVTVPVQVAHSWSRDGWTPFERKIVTQDGSQSLSLSVNGDYGRVTGTGADDGNQRDLFVHRDMVATDGEITAVIKGPSTYVSGNRPQGGVVLRYQEIDGFHVALVVWYDSFAGNPRVQNLSGWRGNGGTTLNQASGGQYTAQIARDLRVLGVRRFDFLGTWINEYACQPPTLHGLASGASITTDVNDDTFDATAAGVSNPDTEKGTFQLTETTTMSAVTYKAADGTATLTNNHERFWPYVLKVRLVDETLQVKTWRGRYESEPGDWQATVTVATDGDFPTLPSGEGGFGVVGAHAHDDSYLEYGDITFKRLG